MKRQKLILWVLGIVLLVNLIAVPLIIRRLTKGKQASNGAEAIGFLKKLVSSEAIWLQQGPRINNMKVYWTYDISCFHRMYRPGTKDKVALLPLDVARADAQPAALSGDAFGPELSYEDWTASGPNGAITPQPYHGYWFRAMQIFRVEPIDPDPPYDRAYNQNPVGDGKVKATNSNQFGFVAYPDKYGVDGIYTFVVNEAGTIYKLDCGSDAKKIILRWSAEIYPPRKDPSHGGTIWYNEEGPWKDDD